MGRAMNYSKVHRTPRRRPDIARRPVPSTEALYVRIKLARLKREAEQRRATR